MAGKNGTVIADGLRGELTAVREAAVQLLEGDDSPPHVATRILRATQNIESSLATLHRLLQAKPSGKGWHRNQLKQYAVECSETDSSLVEHRAGSNVPFRVPKRVYDALVRVLAANTAATKFPGIQANLTEALGRGVPDYAIRTCLRFLASPGVGLVRKDRTRYAALQHEQLVVDARDAWQRLKCSA
jgi:hypothetical protein